MLTILDKPALKQLSQLVETLSKRVDNDKEVLFCVGQIKRIDPQVNIDSRPAAGLLMNFSRGCDTVLGIMGPLTNTTPSSPSINSYGSDGYHSDCDQFGEDCNAELVRQYRVLYIKNRTGTLESLDKLAQLKHVHYLKVKILFSIIVVSI